MEAAFFHTVIARRIANLYDREFFRHNRIRQEATMDPSILQRLMEVIEDRRADPPQRSYTSQLFCGGVRKIGGKILEEAREVVDAASEPGDAGNQHLVHEAADLIYHLFVMLGYRQVRWVEVEAELARRFGISGLDEKAARSR
jgi:phosphoribosyl-ATP pyrophosphohydrolase